MIRIDRFARIVTESAGLAGAKTLLPLTSVAALCCPGAAPSGDASHEEPPVPAGCRARPAGDRRPSRGRAGLAESPGSAEHLRARRDRGEPPGRTRLLDPLPRGPGTDLAASAGLSDPVAAGLRDRRRRDAPGPAAPGAGPGPPGGGSPDWASCGSPGRWSPSAAPSWRRGRTDRGACHPTLVYSATHVQVAGWPRPCSSGPWSGPTGPGLREAVRDAATTGALLGWLACTDPILSLASIGCPGPSCRAGPQGRSRAEATRLLPMTVCAAWESRPGSFATRLVHGEFVAIKSTFGYAFWQGNCALSEGTDKVRRAVDRAVLAAASR